MNFQKIRTAYQCEIQLLSPVHVGSGEKYVNNFDFLREDKKIRVFDHKRLFAMVEKLGGSQIESFAVAVEEKQLGRWLRENNININEAVVHSFNWTEHNEPGDINRHLRDGFGRPMIPGSSLKGAFRTAILSSLAGNDSTDQVKRTLARLMREKRVNAKFADSALCKELLGKDAKMNLMRTLTVADFTFAPKDLQVQPAYVTRLMNNTKMARKSWNILIEKLNQNATATSQISFDDFLLAQAKGKEAFNFKADLTLPWLLRALRERTGKHLDSELSFLSNKNGDYVDSMKRFYITLKQNHQNLGENEAIVQFAWGSGWKGMTGELIDQEALTSEIRSKLRLAPNPQYLNFPFPKSRRVTGTDAIPMGWILLKFTSKEELRQAEAMRLQKEKHAQQEATVQNAAAERERQTLAAMSEAERLAFAITQDRSSENEIVEIFKKLDGFESADQKIIAAALKRCWELAGKWSKKQCSKKQWEKVQKVKSLLGEA